MDYDLFFNFFKRFNFVELIVSELSLFDYCYEILFENCEYKNCDEVLKEIYKVIYDSFLN